MCKSKPPHETGVRPLWRSWGRFCICAPFIKIYVNKYNWSHILGWLIAHIPDGESIVQYWCGAVNFPLQCVLGRVVAMGLRHHLWHGRNTRQGHQPGTHSQGVGGIATVHAEVSSLHGWDVEGESVVRELIIILLYTITITTLVVRELIIIMLHTITITTICGAGAHHNIAVHNYNHHNLWCWSSWPYCCTQSHILTIRWINLINTLNYY